MDHLTDYVQWMGEFPISVVPFREADALVLCALSYVDFTPFLPEGKTDFLLKDCESFLRYGQPRIMITGEVDSLLQLLKLAVGSRRFGELRVSDYVDLIREDPPLQFSALCFHGPRGLSFLAYRGTDSTLAGWEEDFMISFTRTEAQELALRYAEEHITSDRRWLMGGHSKGGNLVLFASCLLSEEKWRAVRQVYMLDGPGFDPDVMAPEFLDRVEPRVVRILPRFSIVGKLFEPPISDRRIVRSSGSGFGQHSLLTWGIDHGKLALAEDADPISRVLNSAIADWIQSIPHDDRASLVGDLFHALAASGAEQLDELDDNGLEGLAAMLRSLRGSGETTRAALADLPRRLIAEGFSLKHFLRRGHEKDKEF